MSAVQAERAWSRRGAVALGELGALRPVGRPGGQGRVFRPEHPPAAFSGHPIVVKLYRRAPPAPAGAVLAEMLAWAEALAPEPRRRLHRLAAWPLAMVVENSRLAGIVMTDLSSRFEVPFLMPSGRTQPVLLSLEHLLGGDDYLRLRGLDPLLDTETRVHAAERISAALAFLHRHAIVVSDIAPNNLLLRLRPGRVEVCLIDCDSMIFRGRQALAAVETGDWQLPPAFAERPLTRAADAYKLALIILRLLVRSHDARQVPTDPRAVPEELRELLRRGLSADAANRPPAGEWQRTLSQLLAVGRLSERYARPVALPPATPPRPARAAVDAPLPRRQAHRAPSAGSLVTAAWFVVLAVLFTLLLARLIAATIPTSSPPPAGYGQPALGAPNGSYGYQYAYPPAQGGAPDFR